MVGRYSLMVGIHSGRYPTLKFTSLLLSHLSPERVELESGGGEGG